jgi:two-component system phosphate regulon sensor histidine kinase PhoR
MVRSKNPSSSNLNSINNYQALVSEVLFYSIGEGAIIIDERGNIARVNEIALDILGFEEKEIVGKWLPEALVAEDESGSVIPNYERPATGAFLSGKPVSRRIFYRTKNGERVAVAVNVAPILLRGEPIGAIQLFRDITDEVRLERAKDEFISIASHQLRTPATVVKQNIGLILEGYIDSHDKKLELLQTAYEYNNSQLQIINDLLNIAQVEAQELKPHFQDVDMNNLLQRVVDGQIAEYKKRGIDLKLIMKNDHAVVKADPLHMQMVFENLINNAQKYSSAGTRVTVTVAASPKAVTVRIKDQGIGIAMKDIPALFHKFSRIENVNSMASGTGLGLYWAKKLVELHAGEIKVASELNKGTTFKVILPGVAC